MLLLLLDMRGRALERHGGTGALWRRRGCALEMLLLLLLRWRRRVALLLVSLRRSRIALLRLRWRLEMLLVLL